MQTLLNVISGFAGAWAFAFIAFLLSTLIGDFFKGRIDFILLFISLALSYAIMARRPSFKEFTSFKLGVCLGLLAYLVYGFGLSKMRIENFDNPINPIVSQLEPGTVVNASSVAGNPKKQLND